MPAYRHQFLEDRAKHKWRIFAVIYVFLIVISISGGIAFRMQGLKDINSTPSHARVDPYKCVFCPGSGADPLTYTQQNDPSLVYCSTSQGVNVPIKNATVNYTYKGETVQAMDTDPNGLATTSNLNWKYNGTNEVKLTRSLDTATLPTTIKFNNINYTLDPNKAVTNQPQCASFFVSPFGVSSIGTAPATASPCCTNVTDGSGKLNCTPTGQKCTLAFGQTNNLTYRSWTAGTSTCSGKSAVTGFNPLLPANTTTKNYWAPAAPVLPAGDTGTNTIDNYVNYKGPLLKFKLSCNVIPECSGITGLPSKPALNTPITLSGKTTADPQFTGPYQWYFDQNAVGTDSNKYTFTLTDNISHNIWLEVAGEIKDNNPAKGVCRVSVQAGKENKPTPTPTPIVTPTPTPIVTPTPTPIVTPTPTPIVTPTPTSIVTPTPTPTPRTGVVSVQKSGSVCTGVMPPNNVSTFKVTIFNRTGVVQSVTSIVDTLPPNFRYVSNSTYVNGVAFSDTYLSIDNTLGYEVLTWDGVAGKLSVPIGGQLILTFNTSVDRNALSVGQSSVKVTNTVDVNMGKGGSLQDTYDITIAEGCTPDTAFLGDKPLRVLLVAGLLFLSAGIIFQRKNMILTTEIATLFKGINGKINGFSDMLGYKTNPQKQFVKRIKKIVRKK